MTNRFGEPNSYAEAKRIAFEVTHDNPTSKALADLFEHSFKKAVQQVRVDLNIPSDVNTNLNLLFQKYDNLYTTTYEQVNPSDTWIINHGLGRSPGVAVVDSAGTLVFGKVTYLDDNRIRLEFNGAFAGTAYLN